MTQNEQARIIVSTRSAPLRKRLKALIALWAEAYCVQCAVKAWDWRTAELPREDAQAILFLDLRDLSAAAAEERRYVAQLPRGCTLIVIAMDETQAIRAYRWHPAARLDPDLDYPVLCAAMDQCFSVWRQYLRWLDLPFQWERVRVPLCQLQYAEARGRESVLRCAGGEMRASVALGAVEQQLPSPPFFRCQKGFLIHLGAVEQFDGGTLTMTDRQTITVGRKQARELQTLLEQWQTARRGGRA